MTLGYFQKGFNFSQDGPGNRLVFHLQGCNLKCPWCANPEGLNPAGECIKADIDDMVNDCLSCSMLFFEGGGVTLTGGEPTMQFEAVKDFFTKLSENGINTALECNATHKRLPELFDIVDYLIFDCKHYSSLKHKEICGLGNETILQNIALACKEREQLLIRIPLINGFNSSAADAQSFAALFKRLCGDKCRYELLRYHEFGKDKYKKCGLDYTVTDGFVSDADFEEFKRIFKENGLITIHT